MQCGECGQWAHRECAGYERGGFMCEICVDDYVASHVFARGPTLVAMLAILCIHVIKILNWVV